MQSIINYYRLLNILSLDVAIGATISAFFLTQVFNVTVTYQGLLCLGLTVWLIYTADHLMDAKLMKNEASTLRHRFHQRHFKIILVLAGAMFASILPLLFFIHKPVFSWGSRLLLFVVMYFIVQRRLGILKEMLGALLYCVGVMLPVIALSEMSFFSLITIPGILFFGTALINLILFSWFDKEKDLADNHPSLVTNLGKSVVNIVLYFLFFIQFGLMVYANAVGTHNMALVVFGLMYVVLLAIFFRAKWFALDDRYRLAGDAIFVIPLIYLIL